MTKKSTIDVCQGLKYTTMADMHYDRNLCMKSVRIQENTEQKKLRIWTFFTKWMFHGLARSAALTPQDSYHSWYQMFINKAAALNLLTYSLCLNEETSMLLQVSTDEIIIFLMSRNRKINSHYFFADTKISSQK